MRTISSEASKEASDRKRRRGQLIIGLVMIGLMVLSSVGYAFSVFSGSNSGTQNQPSGQPVFDGSSWIVDLGGKKFSFLSSIDDVRNVSFNASVSAGDYSAKSVYLVAESPAVLREIQGVVGPVALRMQEACYGPCNRTDLPEKDCSNQMIIWHASETNRVYQRDSCVFIEGDMRAVDAFLYRLLGLV